ncbi:hypothetical protein HDU92_002128 [Lobulomyces angularis]|nr:hypothetical protein HDU92_002128 [Lobulomyces angularis]
MQFTFNSIRIFLLFVGYLICEASLTLISKDQDLQCVKNCQRQSIFEESQHFNQPYLQLLAVLIGMVLCLIPGYIMDCFKPDKIKKSSPGDIFSSTETLYIEDMEQKEKFHKENKLKKGFFLVLITFIDLFATFFSYLGLIYISASIHSMLSGSVILFTTLFSILILKNKYSKVEYIFLFVVFMGAIVVGFSSFYSNTDNQNVNIADAILSIQAVLQEKFLDKFKRTNPMLIAGYIGFIGLVILGIISPVVQYSVNHEVTGNIFNIVLGYNQVMENKRLLISFAIFIPAISIYNVIILYTLKYSSALNLKIVGCLSPVLVWFVSFLAKTESFFWIQFLGFVLMICGTILFEKHELVKQIFKKIKAF